MIETSIRRATKDDLPAVQDLIRQSYLDLVKLEGAVLYDHCVETAEKAIREGDISCDNFISTYTAPRSAFWVAECEGCVIGSIGVHPSDVKDFENMAEVVRMVVSEDLRGRGVGRSLIQTLESYCLEVGYHSIHLYTANRNSKVFYEKCGYLPYSTVERSITEVSDGSLVVLTTLVVNKMRKILTDIKEDPKLQSNTKHE